MSTKNKKLLIITGVALFLVIMIGGFYNKMVKSEENVENTWAQVESAYQRRADLIPNLVNTVKGAADFEKGTLEAVIEARSNATSIKIDPQNLTEENLAQFQNAQNQLNSAISKLMVVVERYPDLKATKNFSDLQVQLEGTENRINVARNKFNEAVKNYNVSIRRFPANIFAKMLDFEKKAYFEAQDGAEQTPNVNFDFE